MDFQSLRKEYENHGIDEATLLDCPIQFFKSWFQVAQDNCPTGWIEPNAMTVATADASGYVTARVLLLKGITDSGFRFFTNYDSQKGQQLAENPRAALEFHWPYLGRQVRLEGSVIKTTREVSEEYFHSRPRAAQIAAAVSSQSSELATRHELETAAAKLSASLENAAVPLPDNWGGYELTPVKFEFWQGRSDRMHDRIVYQKSGGTWHRFRICP